MTVQFRRLYCSVFSGQGVQFLRSNCSNLCVVHRSLLFTFVSIYRSRERGLRRTLCQTRREHAGEAIQSAAAGSSVHQRCRPGCTRRFVLWDTIREEQSLSLSLSLWHMTIWHAGGVLVCGDQTLTTLIRRGAVNTKRMSSKRKNDAQRPGTQLPGGWRKR